MSALSASKFVMSMLSSSSAKGCQPTVARPRYISNCGLSGKVSQTACHWALLTLHCVISTSKGHTMCMVPMEICMPVCSLAISLPLSATQFCTAGIYSAMASNKIRTIGKRIIPAAIFAMVFSIFSVF